VWGYVILGIQNQGWAHKELVPRKTYDEPNWNPSPKNHSIKSRTSQTTAKAHRIRLVFQWKPLEIQWCEQWCPSGDQLEETPAPARIQGQSNEYTLCKWKTASLIFSNTKCISMQQQQQNASNCRISTQRPQAWHMLYATTVNKHQRPHNFFFVGSPSLLQGTRKGEQGNSVGPGARYCAW